MYRSLSMEEFLGTSDEWHDQLESLPQPPVEQMHVIWEKSVKEQELGILGPWLSRRQLDSKYGRRMWRAYQLLAPRTPSMRNPKLLARLAFATAKFPPRRL